MQGSRRLGAFKFRSHFLEGHFPIDLLRVQHPLQSSCVPTSCEYTDSPYRTRQKLGSRFKECQNAKNRCDNYVTNLPFEETNDDKHWIRSTKSSRITLRNKQVMTNFAKQLPSGKSEMIYLTRNENTEFGKKQHAYGKCEIVDPTECDQTGTKR